MDIAASKKWHIPSAPSKKQKKELITSTLNIWTKARVIAFFVCVYVKSFQYLSRQLENKGDICLIE